MVTINIGGEDFRDKVYGCWLGKNAGGTLGQPLEEAWGRPEPFDVWWYTDVQEGGSPNDDLEMQLIWLKALEEVGPDLRAADLAGYWLDHIGYNWDEYGLSKTNLRLGLLPPVSGAYNNWFKDCMGAPIRSEIWACVAPGVPRLAARYAYEDAICDHAGGEGVFGELFNAAVESAAFALDDRERLLDIGLSYVPEGSRTARAIRAARASHAAGEDWLTARRRVLEATPHHVAQYAPINLGFQVVGWLYGDDVGDALCKTVNCGYDTDCTGATVGAILGILAGQHGLPRRWTAPLGDSISTNESWGGLRHASDGPNPVPATLDELTERVRAMTRRVLAAHGLLGADGTVRVDPRDLEADEGVRALWSADPMRAEHRAGTIHVGVDYGATPAVLPDSRKTVVTRLTNPHPDPVRVRCAVRAPAQWPADPEPRTVEVAARSTVSVQWEIAVPAAPALENANLLRLDVQAAGYPAQGAVPVTLPGAARYRYAGPYPSGRLSDRELFDRALEPEAARGPSLTPDGRAGDWRDLYAPDNRLPLGDVFAADGALYAQTFLRSPEPREVWIGVSATCPSKLWVNGEVVAGSFRYRPVRPNYDGPDGYGTASLAAGWNEVLLKFVRHARDARFDAYLLLSSADRLHDGLPDIGRTGAPWDE